MDEKKLKTLKDIWDCTMTYNINYTPSEIHILRKMDLEIIRSAAKEWIEFWENWIYAINNPTIWSCSDKYHFTTDNLKIHIPELESRISAFKHFFNLEEEQ
jgi:hypothetical protein